TSRSRSLASTIRRSWLRAREVASHAAAVIAAVPRAIGMSPPTVASRLRGDGWSAPSCGRASLSNPSLPISRGRDGDAPSVAPYRQARSVPARSRGVVRLVRTARSGYRTGPRAGPACRAEARVKIAELTREAVEGHGPAHLPDPTNAAPGEGVD